MKKVIITIHTINDVFKDRGIRAELSRILHEYATKVEEGDSPSNKLLDINGNVVGTVSIT